MHAQDRTGNRSLVALLLGYRREAERGSLQRVVRIAVVGEGRYAPVSIVARASIHDEAAHDPVRVRLGGGIASASVVHGNCPAQGVADALQQIRPTRGIGRDNELVVCGAAQGVR